MPTLKSLIVIILCVSMVGCSKSKDAGAGHGGFSIPVVGVKITPQLIQEKVPVIGSLSANEAVEMKSEIDGTVREINFEEGQKVKKGDVLIVLDRAKLEATLAQAQANADIAQTTFKRMGSLVEGGAVSQQEFDQSKSEVAAKGAQADLIKAQLADTQIIASFDGTVGARQVSLGQVISKDTLLTVLIDGDPMKADFHVPERYMGRLKIGQPVELKVAAYGDKVFKGEVYFIDPQVDELTRTVLVKAKIPNPDGELRRGMFVKLDLVISEKSNGLAVPEVALIPKNDDVFLFTIDAEGKAQMQMVKTGVRMPGMVEIISGLKAGDTVITEGFQKIGPGAPVQLMPTEAPKEPAPQGKAS